MSGYLECCSRCLHILYDRGDVQLMKIADEDTTACLDDEACEKRQAKQRESHRREIGRRLRAGRGRYTHLVVVQDKFGAVYGYGNFYLEVDPGQTPVGRLTAFLEKNDYTMEGLVVEKVLPIESDPETVPSGRTAVRIKHPREKVPDGICGERKLSLPLAAQWPCVREGGHEGHHEDQFGGGWDEFGWIKVVEAEAK